MIVTDSKGRALDIRPLSFAEEMELALRCATPQDGALWWYSLKYACSVRKIGDSPVHMPYSAAGVPALLDRLGDEALDLAEKTCGAWAYEAAEPAQVETKPISKVELIKLLAMGGRAADVPVWRGVAATACAIRKIGDEVLEFPKTKEELRERVARLDEPAVRARLEADTKSALERAFGREEEEPKKAEAQAAELEEAAKN
jgi:hypothetical protein